MKKILTLICGLALAAVGFGQPTPVGGGGVPTGGTTGQVLAKKSNANGDVQWISSSGSGTVQSVAITTANGVSAVIANPTTNPVIVITLGDITPSSVAATGAVSGTSLTASGLTATRVPFITTGGLLTDSASLTFNSGTGALTATTFVGAVSGNASTATSATSATNATNVGTTQVSNSASYFPLFVASSTNGNQAADLGTGLTFNPSTNTLTTTTFSGALAGNATTSTTATNATNSAVTDDTTTNATMYLTWVTANTGNLPLKLSSTKLSFNPSTGLLTVTGIAATSPAFTTSVTTPSTTVAVFNTTATTVNAFGGASVALNMGNASGATTMLGILGVDGATPSSTTALIVPASTTGVSSARIPHGSAPTSPVNGDIWTTTSGFFVRVNGSTQQMGTASVPGSDTQVIFNDGGSAFGADAGMTYNKTTDTLTVGALTVAGTPTGLITITGATSGHLKITGADAMAHDVTVSLAAQTSGDATATIPDLAGAAATFAFINKAQTWTGVQSLTSPDIATSITTATTSFTAWAGATTLLTIGGTGASASMFAPSTLDTSSSTTGAIRTSGGISAAKALNIGTTGNFGGAVTATNFVGTFAGNTISTGTGTLTLGAGKTTTFDHTSTFTTTDAQTYTFPTTTATLARTDAAQNFTGVQTITNLTLPTNGQILMTVPTTDGHATGPTNSDFNCGYTSSAVGDLVYLDSSSTWQKTDANTLALYNGMLGIALQVKSSGQALLVAEPGCYVYATGFPTWTIGSPIYMSETPGVMTQTAPTTTDAAIRIVGWGIHADKMKFAPSPDYITHI